MKKVLPPGTILQHLYLKERLRLRRPGRFVEVGCGDGVVSRLLLEAGWKGVGYDLNPAALDVARGINAAFLARGDYEVRRADWLSADLDDPADLVISCLVVEHLSDEEEASFYKRARETLAPGGVLILLVPGSPSDWGIEDEIAGHLRRYDPATIAQRLAPAGLAVAHWAGLTFPLSNLLLPLANRLVARTEADLAALPEKERTIRSGHRRVPFKTFFPAVLGLILNELVLYPWHLLQKMFRRHPRAQILYVESRVS